MGKTRKTETEVGKFRTRKERRPEAGIKKRLPKRRKKGNLETGPQSVFPSFLAT